MNYIEKLDNILLSDKATMLFPIEYEKKGFRTWLNKICPEVEKCVNQEQIHPYQPRCL